MTKTPKNDSQRYESASKVEKRKWKCGCERYQNLPEDKNQKLVE